ncbi:MAG: dockerin type I repeat-containing protein, partial [Clostridia bacterium]|nr:dockerin type I repeat-containing protein [Clostridia bacterium]
LTVGDVTDQVLYDNFSYLGAMGAYYVEENGKGANGWNVGNAYDYTSVGIKIDGIGDMDFINVQIVSYNYTEQVPDTHHVYLTDKCDDNVTIINLACWAMPDNFVRVDSGSLNVYCADFNDNAKTSALTKIGEKGKLYLQNGVSPNGGVKILAAENLKNLTVSGYINEFGLTGENECNWGTNMVRVLRWDVPGNATIDKTQKMVFTEGFTGYKTETVGELANVLSKDGSFNVLPTATANGSVTLQKDGNEDVMRLYHTGATQSVYARSSSLRMKSGRANNTYMLETRLNVKSLRDANKSAFTLTVYNMAGANPSGAVDLVSFKPDGVYVGEQKLTDKVTNTWYRVQVSFDLTGTSGKTYSVRLLDDEYKVVAEAKNVALPAACQGNKNDLGTLSLVANATRTEDAKTTEVLVDYLFVQQDPTVVADPVGMLGDVDGDGGITSTDARLTLQFYAGKITENDLNTAVADVDGDGSITSTDARLILQYYAGKITDWP